ncbi:MAG: FKBP-type peptidyl-prolyl cis-trans isomerase [Acidobacteria bacterium]|nr:FKBP-type peptidyl-prolyl cis-trans isomerase [Acidobacteriota bacterium]
MRSCILAFVHLLIAASLLAQTPSTIPAPSDVAAPPSDATKTPSGLATKVVKAASGNDHPTKDDIVTVHYTGWKTDGTMFDSSVARKAPMSFRVSGVIAGFSEGLQMMVVGETRRLWIPESLAYKGQREPKGMLVFDVELLGIPSKAPADVKAPPADAMKTASGLAYKVLQPGINARHPRANSEVTVHYTGWTTDGRMFDSSVVQGKPATFSLGGVIPGWTEGLQLMAEGGKMRFWIPAKLAYEGQPSRPQGMLVFDVELIKIQ